ncbi:F0F1 ATP synthase subunit epsilon [Vibrio fluvialis]|nr:MULTISPECIES: F0F1 ATP synthase subunit epsilon [Vibrio]ELC0660993.1 F0F1 ATP synthase subunit epsilon [Vibrio fluvialis]ELU8402431.1 F0F1 ATP synthase subunit epsilon [Vibrio fluvialis]
MTLMTLKVLLPFDIFASETNVSRIVIETITGSFGLLPSRLDCVAALAPGLLYFVDKAQQEVFVALDEGVLIKTKCDVVISVRRAIRSQDLAHLQEAIKQQFLTQDVEEVALSAAMDKLEMGFMRRFALLNES